MDKEKILWIGAISCGILAVLLTHLYVKRIKDSVYAGMELQEIIITSQDLEQGATLSSQALASKAFPKKFSPTTAVRSKEMNMIIEKKLLLPLRKGDPILWSHLYDPASDNPFSQAISPGERALTIAVDSVSSVGGLIQPNNHVDIFATFRGESHKGNHTITLLENVTVLACGKNRHGESSPLSPSSSATRRSFSTATLLVTEEEAKMLILAQTMGKLTLVLRNQEDLHTSTEPRPLSSSDIKKPAVRAGLQKKRNRRIEVIKQGKTVG